MRIRLAGLALLVAVLGLPLVGADRADASLGTGTMEDGIYGTVPAGNGLRYKVYTPGPRPSGPAPLIVFLHGCSQNAIEAARSTLFNETADEFGFFVVYPDQDTNPAGSFSGTSNGSGCWNWFNPTQQGRGTGDTNGAPTTEPAAIAGITKRVMSEEGIDPRRVYVVGISAGADMATILGATYPDLFAAIGSFAGCAYKTCADLTGSLARDAMTPARERQMPVFIGQGTNDNLNVYPLSEELLHQWLGTNDLIDNGMADASVPRVPAEVVHNGLDETLIDDVGTLGDPCPPVPVAKWPCAGALLGLDEDDDYPTTIRYYDDADGNPLIEFWTIWGLSHAYPGGDSTQKWTDQIGPNPNVHLYNFFMAHPMPVVELSIDDFSVTEGNTGEVDATFTVSLSKTAKHVVTVDVSTENDTATAGADYLASSVDDLTFSPGEATQTFTVRVIGDTIDEPDETFDVNLSSAVNADILDDTGIGTIVDDDVTLPSVSVSDVLVAEAGTATFTVSLSEPQAGSVSVDADTSDGTASSGSDYQPQSSTLTFTPGETSKVVAVAILGDELDESNETFNVDLSNPVGATIADAQGQGTITDDDEAPSLTIDKASVKEGSSGPNPVAIAVTLSTVSGREVRVDFATRDGSATEGSDYIAEAGTLTFSPGETSMAITVTVLGDAVKEKSESFYVDLSAPVNTTLSKASGKVTLRNDDA